jgi:hypothetical protein
MELKEGAGLFGKDSMHSNWFKMEDAIVHGIFNRKSGGEPVESISYALAWR